MSPENIFNSVPEINHAEPAAQIVFEEFVKTVESRRSVRVYDGTPIPEKTMRRCLELALLAPTSSNLQCWEFHWVRSPEKKKKLIEACLGQPAAATAAEIVVAVARTGTWRVMRDRMLEFFAKQSTPAPQSAVNYYQKLVPLAYEQGPLGTLGLIKKVVFWIAGFWKVVPREPTSMNDMKIWAAKTTALACENFMLSMRAAGFDTCPMEGLDSKRVRNLLGLPRDAMVVMAISAGKRAPQGVYGPRVRFDSSLFIKEV